MLIYPSLRGMVYFYQVPSGGLLIEAEVFGLPDRGSLDAPVVVSVCHRQGYARLSGASKQMMA